MFPSLRGISVNFCLIREALRNVGGSFFMQESLVVYESFLYLAPKFKQKNTMNQEELNQLHGLLTTFKRTMITEEHTMEDLHAVSNTAFIVSETKPNA